MSDALILASKAASADLAKLADDARGFIDDAKARSTRRAYRRAWRAFVTWSGSVGLVSLPAQPGTVALYLTKLANDGRKVPTINTALVAINQAHHLAHHPLPSKAPEVSEAMKGIRNRLKVAPVKKKAAVWPLVRKMADALPTDLRGVRDRALLLLGFAGAFRRSELVGLDVGDLELDERGMIVTLRVSKTDQQGKGTIVGIPSDPGLYCPVAAVHRWLATAGIEQGAVFHSIDRWDHVSSSRMSDRAVARAVKAACKRVELDPEKFAGHSLRSGFITWAARSGKPDQAIMLHTRHKHVPTFWGYIQRESVLRDNVASGLMTAQ